MTAIKNGIKCTLRTPWKTILFSMVLILLSALLTVSLCVYTAVRRYLSECDEYYHTIADLEYIGNEYPMSTVYDPTLIEAASAHRDELDALIRSEEVISFETESNTVAIVDGFHRWDNFVADPSRAVLRLSNQMYDSRYDMYLMIVSETYYASKDYTGTLLYVRTQEMPGNGGKQLEKGKTYYTAGRFFKGQTNNPWFYAEETRFVDDGQMLTLPAFTADDEDGDAYLRYAYFTSLKNDSCRVYYSASLDDYPPFQQQRITLIKGRLFTEQEYSDRAKVCVVSDRIAGAFGLGTGDRLPLSVFSSAKDLYEPGTWETVDEGDFEIVGIYKDSEEYPYRIYLPDANAIHAGIQPVTGYRLGHFRIQNDRAAAFEQLAQPLSGHGFRITVYDQGYAAATEPMRELMFISIVFLAVCLLLALVAHALQSHLFVSRQKESALTMRALGSGKPHVILYFLSAALLLAIVSTAIGCVIGKLLEQRVMDALRQFATQFADKDLRFSGSRLSLSRTLAFEPSIGLGTYLLSAALLIAGSLLFTAVSALKSLQDTQTRKKKRTVLDRLPKRAGKSTKLKGVLKYALLSMRRGVIRTVAVVLLCLMTAVFFGRLTASLDGYRTQLETYRKNAVVTGFATDYQGQLIDGLIVRAWPIENLRAYDLLSDDTVTDKIAYGEVVGVAISADGTEHELPPVRIPPGGSFAFDTLIDRLYSKSKWIAASSVEGSPLFHFEKVKDIRWMDGYSDADFNGEDRICALSQSMMEEQGIKLGDTVRILFTDAPSTYFAYLICGTVDIKVVASYAADSFKPYIFTPIGYYPTADVMEELQDEEYGYGWDGHNDSVAASRRTYDSFLFTLRDAGDLDALRQALEDSGFTYVNSGIRSKPFAIIEDEMYLNTTQSMERQIQYVGVLYDALYIITGVIGLVLAWLLTLSRRKEIAIMRAMGTQPIRIVLNFAFEQAALSALGVLLGGAIAVLTGCAPTPLFLILCGAFWGIWNLSTLVCLITGLLKPSYASLTEPE